MAVKPVTVVSGRLKEVTLSSPVGLVAQTTADTYVGRTLTAGLLMAVTNGDGVAGNPTIAQANVFAEASATSNVTTTSATFAVLGSMTLTPVAGTYQVWFATSIDSNSVGADISCALYLDTTQQAATLIVTDVFDGGALSALTARSAVTIVKQVTVNGSQAINVRWATGGGTATCGPRVLNIMRLA